MGFKIQSENGIKAGFTIDELHTDNIDRQKDGK